MTIQEALSNYFVEQGLHTERSTLEDWLEDRWYRIGGVPVLPLVGRIKESLILHDIHHLITGYSTRWTGELELAGWELGSGGCARHWFFWFDRIFTLGLGLVMAPVRTIGHSAVGQETLSCATSSGAAGPRPS